MRWVILIIGFIAMVLIAAFFITRGETKLVKDIAACEFVHEDCIAQVIPAWSEEFMDRTLTNLEGE